ncbi:MAG: type II secretion system F family protein [Alphaproteobacteria bacterium]|nr:type II secretion system F family protein [Alphaproteobacteria bacterium]
MVALAAGGLIFAIIFPLLSGQASASRVKAIAGNKRDGMSSFRARFQEDQKDTRRKQLQDTLNEINEKEKKKKKLSLRVRLEQAGLDVTPRAFYMASAVAGVLFGALALVFIGNPIVAGLGLFVGGLGLPRWVLGYLRKRRQNKFLNDFADAIDVLVRGLKSGLPVSEAMKIISTEQGEPVGPEFLEVVEGQRIGIPIDQGIERMVERVPLPEVNFLAIVMTIQSKTGGNLSEALANLSKVLRDRKKMKAKVQAVSQEAKSSAAIIGSLPFIIVLLMSFFNPKYLRPLFETQTGHMLLIGCGMWMSTGVLVMRKMINFNM